MRPAPDRARRGLRPPTPSPDGSRAGSLNGQRDGAPDNSPDEADPAVLEALPRALRVVGSVVAPTTLLTGLLFYFGRLHATAMYQYFGVHFTVLDLTAQDFLVRSADGLPVPMVVVLGVALLVLWAHRLLVPARPVARLRGLLRAGALTAALTGAVLVGLAIADTLGLRSFAAVPEARGIALALGVLLLAWATRLARLAAAAAGRPVPRLTGPGVVVEWGVVFVLVSIGLFWAVGSYAVGVGSGRAQQITATLADQPDVAVYSEKELGIAGPGVRRVPCTAPDTAFRVRYDGLRLVQQSGGQYLLLPVEWTPGDGPALLVARGGTVRVEFRRSGPAEYPAC